jgi:hypothetical protein
LAQQERPLGSAIAVQASRRQSLTVLRFAGFRRLFLAQTVNLLGSAIAPIALAFAVLGQPGGSATHLGLILAARSLGQVTFLLFGGVLADRMPRLRLMTASNPLRERDFGSHRLMIAENLAPEVALFGSPAHDGGHRRRQRPRPSASLLRYSARRHAVPGRT